MFQGRCPILPSFMGYYFRRQLFGLFGPAVFVDRLIIFNRDNTNDFNDNYNHIV